MTYPPQEVQESSERLALRESRRYQFLPFGSASFGHFLRDFSEVPILRLAVGLVVTVCAVEGLKFVRKIIKNFIVLYLYYET